MNVTDTQISNFVRLRLLVIAITGAVAMAGIATADTAFTYQGRLMHNGEAYNGSLVLLVTLWDAEVDGNLLGSPIFLNEVPVSDGFFTVELNFREDSTLFNGSPRWLQFRVNDAQLTTRQKVTPAPMSIHSHRAAGAVGDFVLHPPDPGMPVRLFFGEGGSSIGMPPPDNGMPWKIVLKAPPDDNMPVALAFGQGGPSVNFEFMPDFKAHVFHLHPPAPGAPVALGFGEVGAKIVGDATGQGVMIIDDNDMPGTLFFGSGGPSIGGFGESGIIIDNGMGDPIAIIDDNDMPMIKIAPAGGHAALTFGPGAVGLNFAPSPFGPTSPPSLNFKGAFVGFGLADGMAPTSGIQLPMAAGSPAGAGLATAWNTYSSSRWKENVETIPDALEKVLALRGVEFAWRDDDSGGDPALLRDIGFIAEEVALVVPELVVWEQDGINAHGLRYDRITALAVEAIKEQHQHIEYLIAENDDLRDRLAILEVAVAELLATHKGVSHSTD